jgi:hypothetical protein
VASGRPAGRGPARKPLAGYACARWRRGPSTDEREHEDSRSPLVRLCAQVADSSRFNIFIFAIILANAVVLGLETYDGIVRDAGGLLAALNDVFLGIFVVELCIRLIGFGSRPQDFFKSGWNVFDFLVIAASCRSASSPCSSCSSTGWPAGRSSTTTRRSSTERSARRC